MMRYLLIIMLIVCNVSFAQVRLHNVALQSGVKLTKPPIGIIFYEDFVFDGDAKILTEYAGTETDIIIPSTINGVPVEIIGEEFAYSKYPPLTSVVIPPGITTIQKKAFSTNGLTSISLPDTIFTIDSFAFSSNDITALIVPDSVKTIALNAFYDNPISALVLSEGVETIGQSAFAYNRIEAIVIPSSVTTMGKFAFHRNKASSIIFSAPAKITAIPQGAFFAASYYGGNVTSIEIPPSVLTIAAGAFMDLPLTTITMNNAGVSIYNEGAYSSHEAMGEYGEGFVAAYAIGGAGTYNYSDGNWIKQ
jgi:hypothetical protein